MNIFRIIIREIRHGKGTFIMGVTAVSVSVLSYIISLSVLSKSQMSFTDKMKRMNSDLKKEISDLENGIRKSMKGLGFNIHIYPEQQDLAEIYEQGYGEQTMPEEYVTRLASQKDLVTVNHLLPSLEQKLV